MATVRRGRACSRAGPRQQPHSRVGRDGAGDDAAVQAERLARRAVLAQALHVLEQAHALERAQRPVHPWSVWGRNERVGHACQPQKGRAPGRQRPPSPAPSAQGQGVCPAMRRSCRGGLLGAPLEQVDLDPFLRERHGRHDARGPRTADHCRHAALLHRCDSVRGSQRPPAAAVLPSPKLHAALATRVRHSSVAPQMRSAEVHGRGRRCSACWQEGRPARPTALVPACVQHQQRSSWHARTNATAGWHSCRVAQRHSRCAAAAAAARGDGGGLPGRDARQPFVQHDDPLEQANSGPPGGKGGPGDGGGGQGSPGDDGRSAPRQKPYPAWLKVSLAGAVNGQLLTSLSRFSAAQCGE